VLDTGALRAKAVDTFHPDQIVIATLPPEYSVWHRFDVVDRARAEHSVPVTHVVATRSRPRSFSDDSLRRLAGGCAEKQTQ
jgi:hypothetical protein